MEIWLQQQASAVLAALAHAQKLYGPPVPSCAGRPLGLPPEPEAGLRGGLR